MPDRGSSSTSSTLSCISREIGGIRSDPDADLAVCAALVSSLRNRPLDPHTLVLGEVGLAGEVRAVGQIELRLSEAEKMGFRQIVLPKACSRKLEPKKISLVAVETLSEALEQLSL